MKEQDIPDANWENLLFWVLRRLRRFRVKNESMLPTLKPGDELLFASPRRMSRNLVEGDIVVLPHPIDKQEKIIKRIVSIESDGGLYLLGDNLAVSDDSRKHGKFAAEDVIGVVVSRFG